MPRWIAASSSAPGVMPSLAQRLDLVMIVLRVLLTSADREHSDYRSRIPPTCLSLVQSALAKVGHVASLTSSPICLSQALRRQHSWRLHCRADDRASRRHAQAQPPSSASSGRSWLCCPCSNRFGSRLAATEREQVGRCACRVVLRCGSCCRRRSYLPFPFSVGASGPVAVTFPQLRQLPRRGDRSRPSRAAMLQAWPCPRLCSPTAALGSS